VRYVVWGWLSKDVKGHGIAQDTGQVFHWHCGGRRQRGERDGFRDWDCLGNFEVGDCLETEIINRLKIVSRYFLLASIVWAGKEETCAEH
jgi:hypothetical protein